MRKVYIFPFLLRIFSFNQNRNQTLSYNDKPNFVLHCSDIKTTETIQLKFQSTIQTAASHLNLEVNISHKCILCSMLIRLFILCLISSQDHCTRKRFTALSSPITVISHDAGWSLSANYSECCVVHSALDCKTVSR